MFPNSFPYALRKTKKQEIRSFHAKLSLIIWTFRELEKANLNCILQEIFLDTPIDLEFKKRSIDCYNLSWSVHLLAKPCVKEYQLVVNQIDKAPLNTTTKTSNYVICSKSIQSCKVRTLCKSNQESDWVTAEIPVDTPQSKGNTLFLRFFCQFRCIQGRNCTIEIDILLFLCLDNASSSTVFISVTIMGIPVIIAIIIFLVLKKKLCKRSKWLWTFIFFLAVKTIQMSPMYFCKLYNVNFFLNVFQMCVNSGKFCYNLFNVYLNFVQ